MPSEARASERAFGMAVFPFYPAGVAQLVEHQPSKLNVAGSNLVARST